MSDYHNYSRDIVIDYSVIDDYDNIISMVGHKKAKLARNAKIQFGPDITPDEEQVLLDYFAYCKRVSNRAKLE